MARYAPTGIMLVVTASVITSMLIACTVGPPSGEPSIRGMVSELAMADGEEPGAAMLITGSAANGFEYDIAQVRAVSTTRVYDSADRLIDVGDLENGMLVEVWLDGPVAESYPVQATAGAMRVLGR